jgi:MoaA/NifB/PqqE/SkfB family radical SAM enzyme/SAM-dependent methyltransferase
MNNSTQALNDSAILYKPSLHSFHRDGLFFFVDPEAPNWIATDLRGESLLNLIDGQCSLGDIRRLYTTHHHLDLGKGWRDVQSFVREGLRKGILSEEPVVHPPYTGRANHLKLTQLREFWIHLLDTCNLSCTHCLVSSHPQGDKGSDTRFYLRLIDEAFDLGARRFYFTGGEPFVRPDIFQLIRHITEEKQAELIILTNATLFEGERLNELKSLNRERLKFQVSLDGTCAEVNDPIRGRGVFQKASEGLIRLNQLKFETSLTAVVTCANLKDLEGLPMLASKLGAQSIHLMWLHHRGRILDETANPFPEIDELLTLFRRVATLSDPLGVVFDNAGSLLRRINGQPGVKYDLGNFCWESLCVNQDGQVYPSAALVGIPELSLGNTHKTALQSLWRNSPVANLFREATVAKNSALADDPFRYFTGGGDMEHIYACRGARRAPFELTAGDLTASDPYHALYVEMIQDIMTMLAMKKRSEWNNQSGFSPPPIYHAMGDDAITCSEDAADWLSEQGSQSEAKRPEGEASQALLEERATRAPVIVRLLHTNCVLSFDVEKPYRIVQDFYGKAALAPQKELCCPVRYDDTEIGHIPKEVIDRFYGCGSPMSMAAVRPGETVLDLGSGAGIDCFIAAKKVGASGKVIGVDMTDLMLEVANRFKSNVAASLGIDVVEFRKGYLEHIPASDQTVDLVTSNCVINLSPDKGKVFSEIWRILKDNGRMVVADIVSDRPVPLNLQAHPLLWGECISGALSEEAFVAGLERAGFYGISILKKTFWKEVEGYPFYSITVRGFKFEKKGGCAFIGQKAIYAGPYKAVMDEEGHLFPRGEAIEVCTDTAVKLAAAPYAGQFTIFRGDGGEVTADEAQLESACCTPKTSCC